MPDPMPDAIPASNYSIDTANGVVTDTVTGLMWQEPQAADKYAWADAICYCASLGLAGYNDWRLPTVIELVSIMDETIASGPTINMAAFPSTAGGWYWTSVPLAGGLGMAWLVGFQGSGTSNSGALTPSHVRCVR